MCALQDKRYCCRHQFIHVGGDVAENSDYHFPIIRKSLLLDLPTTYISANYG